MIDFKIKRNERNEINSKDGIVIEMDFAGDYEIPLITNNLAELYTQTLNIFATINKGQLPHNKDFGVTDDYKVKMEGNGVMKEVYRGRLIEDLMNMATEAFIDNKELLEFASKEYIVVDVGD